GVAGTFDALLDAVRDTGDVDRRAGICEHDVAFRARDLARDDTSKVGSVFGGRAAGDRPDRGRVDPQFLGCERVFVDRLVADLGDARFAVNTDLVHPGTVDDERTLDGHLRERAGDDRDEFGVVHPDDLGVRTRRVRQRPERVEDRPGAEFLSWADDRLHRGVEDRREHESDPLALDSVFDCGRFGIDVHAEFAEYIGTPRRGRDGVVTVFCDLYPCAGRDDRARRRNVDRIVSVPTRAASVDQRPAVWGNGSGRPAHPLCEARDLGFGL